MLRYRDFFPMAASLNDRMDFRENVTLLELLPSAILITDSEGRCLYSNPAYQNLCGWSADELIGSHWSAVMHPHDHEALMGHWRDALQGRNSFQCEARLKRSDGKVLWIRRNASVLNGTVPGGGHVHTVEDISRYKGH